MASQARLVNAVQAHRISVYKELLAGMAGAVDWVLVYSAKPEDRLAQLVYFLKQAIPTSGPFVVREVYQSGTDVCIRFIGRYHQQDYADLAERLFHCTLEQYQTFVPTAQA
ncbi:MAG TPA: hypothetical protein VHA30_01210 [Patescibacteria group bacterium]|nr:hypothetical protein [Patescibacteria group bacterium]